MGLKESIIFWMIQGSEIILKINKENLGIVVHACDHNTLEADSKGWRVSGQSGLCTKILFTNNRKKHN